MVKYTIPQYRKLMQKRIDTLKNNAKVTTKTTAQLIVKSAKMNAPRQSGILINGIRKSKIPNGHKVESLAKHKGFPYNKWVNHDPGYNKITWTKGNRRYGIKPGTIGIYGRSPSHFKWTATSRAQTEGFFNVAVDDGRQWLRKNGINKLRITLIR